jgi:hypothetical protein
MPATTLQHGTEELIRKQQENPYIISVIQKEVKSGKIPMILINALIIVIITSNVIIHLQNLYSFRPFN